MKQNQILFIIIGFILVALMATNPCTAEHKEAIKQKVPLLRSLSNEELKLLLPEQLAGINKYNEKKQLGLIIGMALIEMIKRENYLLFSLSKSKFSDNDEKEKVVGLGILGKVYLANEFSFVSEITEKIAELSNPIIGNIIKIENIEVAEKDFPQKMNWKDAKKACEALGRGWRLPDINELKILCERYNVLWDDESYWSSSYDSSGEGFVQTLHRYSDSLFISFDAHVTTLLWVRAVRGVNYQIISGIPVSTIDVCPCGSGKLQKHCHGRE